MTGLVRPARLSAPQMTAVCIAAMTALCAATLVGLFALGRPSGLGVELKGLDTRLARLEASGRAANQALAYPNGALCEGAADAAARSLQTSMAAMAARFRLAAVSATATAESAEGRLQPLDVSLDANGAYAAAMGMLRGLADLRPTLLVDRVDLVSKAAYLHLHLTGRAYCRSPARP